MINSRLYKLKQEYIALLLARIEEGYKCPKCSKKEVKCSISKEKRKWEIKATCSCENEVIYSVDAKFRGYIIGQYTYVLKSQNPGIKIKFHKEISSTSVPPKKPKKFTSKEIPKQHVPKRREPLSTTGIITKNFDD